MGLHVDCTCSLVHAQLCSKLTAQLHLQCGTSVRRDVRDTRLWEEKPTHETRISPVTRLTVLQDYGGCHPAGHFHEGAQETLSCGESARIRSAVFFRDDKKSSDSSSNLFD
jgi:hypothetical protein